MCGIAGIVKLHPGAVVDETRLKRMRDALRHRGPDGEGLWIDEGVGLGHRRLAIVDIAGGHQPMSDEHGEAWITYNGEIYNHLALRADLEARGHRYRTRSDTETILHAYEEDGEQCVERLRGMFAFAIWDRTRRRLLLARDRLGIKPLYYAVTSDEILFASEIKALLAAGGIPTTFNGAVLSEFLASGYVAGAETFYRGVWKLLPGRTLCWSTEDGFRHRQYWRLPEHPVSDDRSFDELARDTAERLRTTVADHLMSDVPLGLFLSGGIDSSGLAAMTAALATGPIDTFAVGFAEADVSELPFARVAARSVRSRHHEVVVTPDAFFAALPTLVWHEDEPIAFPSSVPLYFVSRLASERVKVVLTGEGADELFLGYNRYRVSAWNARMARWWRGVPDCVRRSARAAVGRMPGAIGRYAVRTFVARSDGVRSLIFDNFAVFDEAWRSMLIAEASPPGRDPYAEGLRHFDSAPGTVAERLRRADCETYLVELLMKQDQMSMAASVESRVPFLDHVFVESALRIPSAFNLRRGGSKMILREALRDVVPPEIVRRPKRGFPTPVGEWFRGRFWPVIQEFVLGERTRARRLLNADPVRRLALAHRAGAGQHADRLWLLLNLELWHRIFIDGDDPASVMYRVMESCASSG